MGYIISVVAGTIALALTQLFLTLAIYQVNQTLGIAYALSYCAMVLSQVLLRYYASLQIKSILDSTYDKRN